MTSTVAYLNARCVCWVRVMPARLSDRFDVVVQRIHLDAVAWACLQQAGIGCVVQHDERLPLQAPTRRSVENALRVWRSTRVWDLGLCSIASRCGVRRCRSRIDAHGQRLATHGHCHVCTRYRLRTHTLAIFAVGVSVPCHQGKLGDGSTCLSIGEAVLDFFGMGCWLCLTS